jgi:hypothetical protein
MKLYYLPLVLVFLFQISACNKTVRNPSVGIVHKIDADNIKDVIDLKLSDMADSFRLVPLETTKECLLDKSTEFYVGKSFIIAYSKNGVYKFSSDGKFIKRLFKTGRGPDEILSTVYSTFVVDDKKDLLYIYVQGQSGKYFVYDLESEHFSDPVKQCFSGFGSFDIYNDSLIVGSLFGFRDTSDYAVYFQNLKGEFVSGITNYKRLKTNKGIISQPGWITKSDSIYYFNFRYDDTLFKITENKLIPYLAFNFKAKRGNPPTEIRQKGDRFIYLQFVTPGFMIIQIQVIEEVIRSADEKMKFNYLLFNNITGKASNINTYIDNFIADTLDVLKMSRLNETYMYFLSRPPNRNLVVAYDPFQIKKAIGRGFNSKDFPNKINQQLVKLNDNLQETDNPILLIGRIKDKI